MEVLGYVPKNSDGLSPCICFRCFNKINKISKIDYDLNNRLDQLSALAEKRIIITELRKNVKKPARLHLSPRLSAPSERPSPKTPIEISNVRMVQSSDDSAKSTSW